MQDRTVLIVEDELSLQELYETILGEAGINTVRAMTGAEGVKLALEHEPDVILMDIELPDISGHAAVEQIRATDWGKTAKIIYLTNHSDAENVYRAVEQKSDEYIIKAHAENKEILNKVRSAMVAR